MDLADYAALTFDRLAERLDALKREKRAVILGHNYQVEDVQRVSDHLGDSLRLAQLATETDADLIVLCGVHFMAESAKILNPDKTVLLPSRSAGCPMADMVTAQELEAFKSGYPEAEVVCYVNTSADVKAVSDVCCTSSNAVDIVNGVAADEIIFVPDKNLAAYVASKTEKTVIPWQGYCYVHNMFVPEDVALARGEHPGVPVVVHPECPADVIGLADYVASTGGMMQLGAEHDELIVGTEIGLIERMNREFPEKNFYPLSAYAVCRNMKMIDLPQVVWALENGKYEIEIPEDIRAPAERSLRRMLELSK
jgi:quinolinate synthase